MSNIKANFSIATYMGMCMRQQKDYEEALRAFEEAENYMKQLNIKQSLISFFKILKDIPRG